MGGACLLFGISRDPTIVSEPIERLDFTGATLSANGVAMAEYVAGQDIWQGLVRSMWWMSVGVVSALSASTLRNDSRIVRLNPWEPDPSQGDVSPPPAVDERPENRGSVSEQSPPTV
jgi:hypothetical protein